MTLLSTVQTSPRRLSKSRRIHVVPIVLGSLVAAGAIWLVSYLLWPTWSHDQLNSPNRIPVSVGVTLFNVPAHAFRVKVQKHSGPQERVDLGFVYPSLEAPEAPRHVSADTVEQTSQPIDRIFLSIAAHHDAMAPEIRLRTIYPHYLEATSSLGPDGLTQRVFRDGSPYGNEDLFMATTPLLVARCSRDAATPGMCLSERRIDGADLTFRFPRQWLAQWRDVATGMERLTAQLYSPRG